MDGSKNTTTTATSYGYGGKSQTNARLRSRKKRMMTFKPYKSKFEYEVATLMEEQGVYFEYEPKQIRYRLPVRGGRCNDCDSINVGKSCIYTPDFWLPVSQLWVEAKGKWDSQGRTKIMAVLNTSGAITLENFRMLFMYNNWITKKHKITYMDWCEKNEIIAAVGKAIPKEWTQ